MPKTGRLLIGMVAGFKSERWPVFDRNGGRLHVGIRTRNLSVAPGAFPPGGWMGGRMEWRRVRTAVMLSGELLRISGTYWRRACRERLLTRRLDPQPWLGDPFSLAAWRANRETGATARPRIGSQQDPKSSGDLTRCLGRPAQVAA